MHSMWFAWAICNSCCAVFQRKCSTEAVFAHSQKNEHRDFRGLSSPETAENGGIKQCKKKGTEHMYPSLMKASDTLNSRPGDPRCTGKSTFKVASEAQPQPSTSTQIQLKYQIDLNSMPLIPVCVGIHLEHIICLI